MNAALDEMAVAAGPQPVPDPFDAAIAFVWRPDNDGQGYHDDPRDPGGATTWGVTFATWSAWQRLHGTTPTLAAFRVLGPDDLRTLYRALFWNACQCGALPLGVGLVVFDAAVGSAPLHAARWLQQVVGVTQDGEIGPETIAAARRMPPVVTINALATTREAFYASLPTFRVYGRGWDRRATDCCLLALSMAGAHTDSTPEPEPAGPGTQE
jgi:lysozyme family protein